MKKHIYLSLSFALSTLLLLGCAEDIEPEQREYPRVSTRVPQNLTNDGITFHAEIINFGEESIRDHGFIWGYYRNGDGTRVRLGQLEGDSFKTRVNGDFSRASQYFVQAYLRTASNLILGNRVLFRTY